MAWGVSTAERNIFSAQDISCHAERRKQTASLYQWNTLFNFEPQLDALSEDFLGRMSGLIDNGEVHGNQWSDTVTFASVGLGVSGSYDLGEIACKIAYNLIILFIVILFIVILFIDI